NEMIFFYWQDVDHGPFRLSSLSLRTGKWMDKKGFRKLKHPWSPLSVELNATKAPLPPHRGAADTFCVIKGHRVILLFGGMRLDGTGPTSDLHLICLDMMKWWQVDIPNEVAPRVDAKMTFIDNRLYIFGGRGHESYSIANFDSNIERWTWTVHDEPYPPHVPHFGFAGNAIPVYGGKQILLIPGCADERLKPPYSNCSPSHVVLFDIASQTFRKYNDVKGEFPTKIYGMNSFVVSSSRLLDGRLAVKTETEEGLPEGMLNACTSVIIAAWHDDELDDHNSTDDEDSDSPSDSPLCDMPDLWLLNLSTTQPSDCCRLNLREKLESLEITVACCDALADRRILLFGSSSTVPNEGFIDRCIEIDLELQL
ncbi:hypothetical protein E4T56_gene15237, partial [Termitomyces sp. T112]